VKQEVGRFQPAEVRRRQILDAVARLVVEVGLEQVSIARVAQEAGVAKGSIYLHYESRRDLFAALQADLWQKMLSTPQRIIDDGARSWVERLDLVVAHWVEFEIEHHTLYHAVFHVAETDAAEPWDQARALLRALLEGGNDGGEFDIEDIDVTVDFLLHAYAGPCYHQHESGTLVPSIQALFRRTLNADQ
jgi:AcrR family transcriptional regulator